MHTDKNTPNQGYNYGDFIDGFLYELAEKTQRQYNIANVKINVMPRIVREYFSPITDDVPNNYASNLS